MSNLEDGFDEETDRLIAELDLDKEKENEGEHEVEDASNEDDNSEESIESANIDADRDVEETDDKGTETEESGDNDSKEEEEINKEDFEPITVKSGDFDIVIDNKEDMLAYIQKGVNAPIASKEKSLESNIMEQGKLTQEDLTLLVDAKNGNKEAIAKLMEIAKVDALDIDEDMARDYKQEFQPYVETDIDKVANDIMQDNELTTQYQNITKQIDTDFVEKVQGNAELLKNFAGHIKSGLAMEIIPQAMTHRMKHGGTFFDAYSTIGQQMVTNKAKETTVEKKPEKPAITQREKSLREKITDQRETSNDTGKPTTSKEIWELTQEEFEEQFGE